MTKSLDSNDDVFDADDIRVHRVTGESCPNPRCKYDDVHIVVEWDGDNYDRQNAWISFKASGVVNRNDVR
jgi:hypothetical protein